MTRLKSLFLIAVVLSNIGYTKNSNEVINELIPIVTIAPAYPKEAAENKIEGKVTIEFTVTTMGTVKNPVIVSTNPKGVFDQAALRAILKYKFKPRTINNKPVEAIASQTINFALSQISNQE